MSTLTDFDSIMNQNSMSGMNLSEQFHGDSSFLSDPVLPCSSYESHDYSLFDTPYVIDKYCAVPSFSGILAPSQTDQVPNTSRDDDEEDSCILSNLPKSCQDFEVKEMNIKLERNQSSPLVAGTASPAHSSRMSSGCVSVEPPVDVTAAAEDLEVQWINESFEEQQKQSQMFNSTDLMSIFYGDPESSKGSTRSDTEKSQASPAVERPDRLPYAKKLLSSQDSSLSLVLDNRSLTPTQLLKPEKSFEPLLTPKSQALLLQNQVLNKNKQRRRVSEPLARKPISFWNRDSISDLSICESTFSDSDSLAQETFGNIKPEEKDRNYITPPPIALEKGTTDSAADLARGIVESLFEGVGLTPLTPNEKIPNPFHSPIQPSNCSRKLDLGKMKNSDEPGTSSEVLKELPKEDDGEGDTWEDIDEDALVEQLEKAKIDNKARVPKKPIDYYAPLKPSSNWDSTVLPHVLEAYNIPEYKMCDDVNNALLSLNYGNAQVKWIERKIVFVAFDNERQARDALVLSQHEWLRLRPLAQSEEKVQKIALEMKPFFRLPGTQTTRPKTQASVARRMVENSLGLKCNVSKEKRLSEKRELAEAKLQKKNAVKWDD